MFLDSLVGDAAWIGRYARDRAGNPMPWPLVEAGIRAEHPYAVLSLRAMLAVSYFEKAMYELPDEALTGPALLALADRVEREVQGGFSARPLLSVPHILSDESSAYYQGYTLAEMAVHQLRAHFTATLGSIVDNPAIGPALTAGMWEPGNGTPYLDLVKSLSGKPLSADSWVAHLELDLETLVAAEKKQYDAALAAGPALPAGAGADLDMRVMLVHGDEVIADSGAGAGAAGLAAANAKFKTWVRATFFK